MKKVVNLYKPLGLSPLGLIDRYRLKNEWVRGKKMSYPGRLDPMAEGVLLVLVGEENKKINDYMKLDKEYEAEILLGFETDSLDLLGVVEGEGVNGGGGVGGGSLEVGGGSLEVGGGSLEVEDRELKKGLKEFKGKYDQLIPVYSSYVVKGKPLWTYARAGELEGIEIPRTKVEIKDVRVDEVYSISSGRLLKEITRKVGLVEGDFRQKEILEKWSKVLNGRDDKFRIVKCRISCSSGTYVRAIARDFGKGYGGGVLFSLKRVRVGRYNVRDSERV